MNLWEKKKLQKMSLVKKTKKTNDPADTKAVGSNEGTSDLDTLMESLQSKFGEGAIMKLGDREVMKVETIPTGSFSLDIALGAGGFPKGRVIEIYGPEASGKTTLALHAVAEETDTNPGRVAIAWVIAKGLIPIIGPRTRAQLDDNLGALAVRLNADQERRLDEVSAVPLGFPHEMLMRFKGLGQQIAGGKADLLDPAAVAVP